MKTNRKTMNGLWMIMLLGSIMSLTACAKKSTEASKSTEATKPTYATMTVATSDRVLYVDYSASIRGRQDVDIYPQVSGTITSINVTEGEKVKKGQVLFVIDQVPYQAALNTALANVEVAKAAVATAELTFNSNKELYAQKVISEFSLKTSENAYLTAKAQLAQAEAQAINARNNLSYTEVKSPTNGVVGALPYYTGALVSPSIPKPLTTVSDNSEMYVYFSMNENQLLDLARKFTSMDEVMKLLPEINLTLNDGSLYEHKGKIESISRVIDRQTGAVLARAVFPNKEGLLLSGANGRISIPHTYKDAIVIPQGATVIMQNKFLVYKVVDGKAVSTIITVSSINDGKEYIVLDGLQVGDVIISDGAGLVREGTTVM